ncbi:hypothetical protein CEQ90_14055 [Lewinellaceae bacterium SD302]|nr:hypothetical protein CEQ90_14055 [Lewinellaceae bacterium SD302]
MRLIYLLLSLLIFSTLGAQHADIHGMVTDENGEPLIGVTVQIKNSVVGDQTDLDGHYDIEAPTGRIRLLFSYVGYGDVDTTLTVALEETKIELNVSMQPFTFRGPQVVVIGRRAVGQAQALKIQQSSPQQVSILHAEVFNKYPDVSLAETVQRMPGVTISRRQGEAEFVQVRGIPKELTIISLNGQRLPSLRAEADRATSLDLIQTNLIEEVYVHKTRTASMDADAIGGSIDFRIRQPEDKLELLLQGGLGSNFQDSDLRMVNRGVQQLGGFINSELSEEKVIALAAGSYFRNGRNNDERLTERGFTGTEGDAVFRYRPTDTDRLAEKIGAIGSIELRPSIYNSLRLTYNFSRSNDEFVQRQATFDLDRNRELRETTNWQETRSINLVTLEVENNFDRLKLDYALSFARSAEDIDDRTRFRYEKAVDDFSSIGDNPSATSSATDSELELRRFAFEKLNLTENIAIGGANLTFFTSELQSSFLKAGIRYRIKDRRFGAFADVLQVEPGTSRIQAGSFGLEGQGIGSEAVRNLNLSIDGLADTDPFEREGAYESEEEILGGYLEYRANWSSKFSSSVGLRYEGTELEYRSLNNTDSILLNYGNLFPSLNLTYRVDKQRQLRLAYYEAIARPAYAQLFPTDQIQSGNRTILRGNAAGTPVSSRNFDLAYERYGRRDGLFSLAGYVKLLDDPFVREARYEELADAPFLVTTVVNAKSAIIAGFEIGIYQNFGFVGPALRHFNVNATYNFNRSNVESNDPDQDGLPVAGSPRQSGNLSIVYNNPNQRLTFVLAANYRDRTLVRLQDGAPIFQENVLNLDISADINLFKDISLYGRLNNLTNPVIREFRDGEPGKGIPYSSQQYGSWAVVGLRWRPESKQQQGGLFPTED